MKEREGGGTRDKKWRKGRKKKGNGLIREKR